MNSKVLDYSWGKKFQSVGWQPKYYMDVGRRIIGDSQGETILGLLREGDNLRNILEIRKRTTINDKYIRKTLLGYTTNHWREDFPKDNMIKPIDTIPGNLLITSKRFIIQGNERYEINFDNIVTVTGGGATGRSTENLWLAEQGSKKHNLKSEITNSMFEINVSNNKNSQQWQYYDRIYIALLSLEVHIFGRPNYELMNLWDDLTRYLWPTT